MKTRESDVLFTEKLITMSGSVPGSSGTPKTWNSSPEINPTQQGMQVKYGIKDWRMQTIKHKEPCYHRTVRNHVGWQTVYPGLYSMCFNIKRKKYFQREVDNLLLDNKDRCQTCGSMTTTAHGKNYILTMTIVEQCYLRFKLLRHKRTLENHFLKNIKWIERRMKVKVVRVHKYNAAEHLLIRRGLKGMKMTFTHWSLHTSQ